MHIKSSVALLLAHMCANIRSGTNIRKQGLEQTIKSNSPPLKVEVQ
jgi:hypothetical protein